MEMPLTENMRSDREPLSLKEYEKVGGYLALRKAVLEMTPEEVTKEVTASNLRGRGGAGFPTGKKWASVPSTEDEADTRYFIADADEMEPGTFKDRLLMEADPHQFIEGMIIASYAVRASTAFIFLRWEYKLAEKRLRKALDEAYEANYVGPNILGSDFSLDLFIHISLGRYICGEGTAMVSALQGERAVPVSKPPLQTISGLWGKPTAVDNVETICNVPHIVKRGAEWFKSLSLCQDGGTKIFGVSGKVKNPGSWELPMGTNLREIIEDYAGGMHDGLKLRAVIPGGASTEFLLGDNLDIPMDFESIEKAGSRLGTANIIVLDDRTCPVGLTHNLEYFFARESCGWCTPCREGLPWVAQILEAMEEGQGLEEDMDLLESHTKMLWLGRTYCALAPGAMEPLKSALRFFRDDFDAHIRQKRCPWRS
ncbi:MAG: NADH-quinone oxidoreductase subunit NuoF [Deltaproteobacteria bacterium]